MLRISVPLNSNILPTTGSTWKRTCRLPLILPFSKEFVIVSTKWLSKSAFFTTFVIDDCRPVVVEVQVRFHDPGM